MSIWEWSGNIDDTIWDKTDNDIKNIDEDSRPERPQLI